MIESAKNKMIDGSESRNKAGEAEREFFFSGGLEYEPVTIRAGSYEEAEKLWEGVRKRVEN